MRSSKQQVGTAVPALLLRLKCSVASSLLLYMLLPLKPPRSGHLLSDTSHGMAFAPSCPLPFETSDLLSLNLAAAAPAHQNFISHLLDLLGLCLDVILQSVLSTLHGL